MAVRVSADCKAGCPGVRGFARSTLLADPARVGEAQNTEIHADQAMIVLGIETSCDETAAALVERDR